ncbi:MAG: zinc ribbon domain-containing protein [Halieaceae bacterium]|jgi:putative FmdB family regulatory protein|uniref:FmdB family zinc ribbon protein n=1 Tax=Haliea alexandrii TaxID=2448162 RepID=UPI000F0B6A05|nr:zinc ribbon domain-containing protein [Haliea alexandrii]MCR9185849.1 zinc ribbon domain-containing protein [Halieaceae bacterium]
MPIYEYQCQACGHLHEALRKISDAPLVDCPACGKAELRKKVSAAGFRLKGGGWYETDFKTSGKKNLVAGGDDKSSAPAASAASADSGSASAKVSEAKPAS